MKYLTFDYFWRFCFISVGVLLICLLTAQYWQAFIIVSAAIIFVTVFLLLRNKPEFLIIISIILNYIPKGTRIGYSLMLLTFIYLLINRIINKQIIFKPDLTNVSWLFIIVLGVITFPKWQYLIVGLQWFAALSLVPLLLYIMIVNEYITPEAIHWLGRTGIPIIFSFIVAETVLAVFLLLSKQDSFFSIFNIMTFHGLEITGNGSNRLAGILVFIAVFGMLSKRYWSGGFLRNLWMHVITFTALIISLLIMSRGAFVSLIVAMLVYGICKFTYERKINVLSIIIFSVSVFVIAKPFIEHLLFRMQNVKIDASTLSRLIMWKNCVTQIKNEFIVGAGPGQYLFRDFTRYLDDPHNMFLRYGVDFGGVSILFLIIILIYPAMLVIKYRNLSRQKILPIVLIYAPPLIGALVHNQIDSTFTSRSSSPLLWLIWALFVNALLTHNRAEALPL
ncbi:MAG: O-antigen ligase family protein [Candidatus Edwardsbacteria bacterium]|nr:O-antigen ligase family protein [Candidatus Edwardsbacteria bacterium]